MQTAVGLRRTVLKNASANILRLLASGIVALLLPPFLVRMLPKDTYSAWSLLLQLTVFVGYLDFGIQTCVARFVAHATELNDSRQRDGIASTAFALLASVAFLALLLLAVLSWQFPQIFTMMPAHLQAEASPALLIMGASFAIGLPCSVFLAIFIGLQRNEVPVAIVVGNRVLMCVLLLAVVFKHFGLVAMGTAVAGANLASYLVSYAAWRLWAPEVKIKLSLGSNEYAKQIVSYSSALAVWFMGSLMVSGLDLSIVGVFDYSKTAYYAIAATLTNFIVQAQSAIFAALMPASAVLAARGNAQRLGALLVTSTRYGMLILLLMALPLFLGGRSILHAWVGPEYSVQSNSLMKVLLLANIVRLSALPYATLLMGTGEQRKVVLSPLAEGFTNLVASLVGAKLLGAVGVAIGTLIGSFVSVGFHLFYNMPRTSAIKIDRHALVKDGVVRPMFCFAPLVALLIFRIAAPQLTTALESILIVCAVIATLSVFWSYGLLGSERRSVQEVLRAS
jgi:O-antigen/teichoic acid export membrane protein